jgi:hypothetical protein
LEQQPEAYEFLYPVDYKGLGLDDYPLIIKNPMDISTVKRRIKQGKYVSLNEVISDLNLIWENCRLYNMVGSVSAKQVIVQQAENMERAMRKYCQKNKINYEGSNKLVKEEEQPISDKPETITFEEKFDLSEKVRNVSHEILAQIVKIVQNDCPAACQELDKDRIQIKLDMMDKMTFFRISE